MSAEQFELRYYTRMWIVVTVATVIGLGLTVALNVMHAPDTLGARLVGGTPPVFVLICLELISRIPATSRVLSAIRALATFVVVGLAFYVSYWQQKDFIMSLGFTEEHASVYPVIIDGAMVVCTLSLVEVTAKVRQLRPLVMAKMAEGTKPVVVTPELIDAEQAGRAFREAAAKLRSSSAVGALNGTAVTPTPVQAAA